MADGIGKANVGSQAIGASAIGKADSVKGKGVEANKAIESIGNLVSAASDGINPSMGAANTVMPTAQTLAA